MTTAWVGCGRVKWGHRQRQGAGWLVSSTDLHACQVHDAAAMAVVSSDDAGDRELEPRAGRRTVPERDVVMQLGLNRSGQHHRPPRVGGVVEAAYDLGEDTGPGWWRRWGWRRRWCIVAGHQTPEDSIDSRWNPTMHHAEWSVCFSIML